MRGVYGPPLQGKTEVERIIDHIGEHNNGPTVVFFGGIHGNEPAGILALKEVMRNLKIQKEPVYGEVYAIAGNLGALKQGVRFHTQDLNRIWSEARIKAVQEEQWEHSTDEKELLELYKLLQSILETGKPPFYFFDLHTTSGPTSPFIVLNDSLLNRKFASNYPLPIILGIEEYLTNALLSFINELGYVSLGFESGQHDDPVAIQNAIDFVQHTLMLTGTIQRTSNEKMILKDDFGKPISSAHKFYEIYYQHTIKPEDEFQMLPGFINFQRVSKEESLALFNGKPFITKRKRQIFMPLYQDQGSEGFYFIRPIPKVLLGVSKVLRKVKVDHLLVVLPGVQWKSEKKDTLLVDLRVARFLAKPIFHLLGYRARQFSQTHLIVKSRETASRNQEYKHAKWF